MKMIRGTAILFVLVSAGCFAAMPTSSGRPIDPGYVKSIEKGKTTMDEVRANLGKPTSITETDGRQEWTYTHWTGKPAMFGNSYSKSSTQILRIQFKGNTVADFTMSTTSQ